MSILLLAGFLRLLQVIIDFTGSWQMVRGRRPIGVALDVEPSTSEGLKQCSHGAFFFAEFQRA